MDDPFPKHTAFLAWLDEHAQRIALLPEPEERDAELQFMRWVAERVDPLNPDRIYHNRQTVLPGPKEFKTYVERRKDTGSRKLRDLEKQQDTLRRELSTVEGQVQRLDRDLSSLENDLKRLEAVLVQRVNLEAQVELIDLERQFEAQSAKQHKDFQAYSALLESHFNSLFSLCPPGFAQQCHIQVEIENDKVVFDRHCFYLYILEVGNEGLPAAYQRCQIEFEKTAQAVRAEGGHAVLLRLYTSENSYDHESFSSRIPSGVRGGHRVLRARTLPNKPRVISDPQQLEEKLLYLLRLVPDEAETVEFLKKELIESSAV